MDHECLIHNLQYTWQMNIILEHSHKPKIDSFCIISQEFITLYVCMGGGQQEGGATQGEL